MDRCASGRAVLRLRGRGPDSRAAGRARHGVVSGTPRKGSWAQRDIPLLRGMNDGGWVRSAGAGVRWAAILLLLALRAGGRPVPAEGGLHRPRRLRESARESAPEDRCVPREGGAGVRAEAGPGRGVDSPGTYLYLEVHSPGITRGRGRDPR